MSILILGWIWLFPFAPFFLLISLLECKINKYKYNLTCQLLYAIFKGILNKLQDQIIVQFSTIFIELSIEIKFVDLF
jgi:hypothetical protein